MPDRAHVRHGVSERGRGWPGGLSGARRRRDCRPDVQGAVHGGGVVDGRRAVRAADDAERVDTRGVAGRVAPLFAERPQVFIPLFIPQFPKMSGNGSSRPNWTREGPASCSLCLKTQDSAAVRSGLLIRSLARETAGNSRILLQHFVFQAEWIRIVLDHPQTGPNPGPF